LPTYPTIAYDTFWIAALSFEKIANNMTDEIDVDNLKKVIISTASLHYGIFGNIVLNDAGDRIDANYDIWYVTKSNLNTNQYVWKNYVN
jgi:ABC-type branched-subunit amino acid transport system substrate-binding protein